MIAGIAKRGFRVSELKPSSPGSAKERRTCTPQRKEATREVQRTRGDERRDEETEREEEVRVFALCSGFQLSGGRRACVGSSGVE